MSYIILVIWYEHFLFDPRICFFSFPMHTTDSGEQKLSSLRGRYIFQTCNFQTQRCLSAQAESKTRILT